MHLTRSLENASIYAVMGLYRKLSFGGNRIAGRDKAEMGINHPLQDVKQRAICLKECVSGHPAQKPARRWGARITGKGRVERKTGRKTPATWGCMTPVGNRSQRRAKPGP